MSGKFFDFYEIMEIAFGITCLTEMLFKIFTVTIKKICLVRIVSHMHKVLYYFVARLLIEKIRPFFLAIELP